MTKKELINRLLKYEEALIKIYKSEYSHMNYTCYECSSILSNIAQDALGIPYEDGDFSIADRYEWETRGGWSIEDERVRLELKRSKYES